MEHHFYKESVEVLMSYHPNSNYSKNFNDSAHSVAVTVGGKNVGKSTFNRYLVNRLLER